MGSGLEGRYHSLYKIYRVRNKLLSDHTALIPAVSETVIDTGFIRRHSTLIGAWPASWYPNSSHAFASVRICRATSSIYVPRSGLSKLMLSGYIGGVIRNVWQWTAEHSCNYCNISCILRGSSTGMRCRSYSRRRVWGWFRCVVTLTRILMPHFITRQG